MNRERVRELFNNGILKAWLDGKTLQYLLNDKWIDLTYRSCIDDLSGLNLRIKPEPIKQTLEWFKYSDEKPAKTNVDIIMRGDSDSIVVRLSNNGNLYDTYAGEIYIPIEEDYWAYIQHPVDTDIPF